MARRGAPTACAALLCAALLAACSGDEAPAPSPAADAPQPQPQPLLALGTVLHAPAAPADARALEVDALVYLRCYATSTKAPRGFDHPDSMLLDAAGNAAGNAGGGAELAITPAMVVAAASASRDSGLHATLPVEAVTSHADVAGGAQPAAGGNAYAVGDWAALGTADLWCELYDIDRALAGMADALGGALLRAADFAAAGTDQLRCAHQHYSCAAIAAPFSSTTAVGVTRSICSQRVFCVGCGRLRAARRHGHLPLPVVRVRRRLAVIPRRRVGGRRLASGCSGGAARLILLLRRASGADRRAGACWRRGICARLRGRLCIAGGAGGRNRCSAC
jgi:hypothetical protein